MQPSRGLHGCRSRPVVSAEEMAAAAHRATAGAVGCNLCVFAKHACPAGRCRRDPRAGRASNAANRRLGNAACKRHALPGEGSAALLDCRGQPVGVPGAVSGAWSTGDVRNPSAAGADRAGAGIAGIRMGASRVWIDCGVVYRRVRADIRGCLSVYAHLYSRCAALAVAGIGAVEFSAGAGFGEWQGSPM